MMSVVCLHIPYVDGYRHPSIVATVLLTDLNKCRLFAGIDVKPSVLHGDLWSGNIGAVKGKPCIFDPAVYFGHHEAEWGMSWCASLSPAFFKGYRSVIPKDDGFRARSLLYEAYHQLNHYNLFGGGYYHRAYSLLQEIPGAVE